MLDSTTLHYTACTANFGTAYYEEVQDFVQTSICRPQDMQHSIIIIVYITNSPSDKSSTAGQLLNYQNMQLVPIQASISAEI